MSEATTRADDALEVARLAGLDPLEYDRQREAVAKQLGVRVSTLDEMVKDARPKPEAADGRGVLLPEAEPWDKPVAAVELLDDIVAAVRRHVILPPAGSVCVALWLAHTWVYQRFQHSPRLSITSPVKRCGKSTLLEVLRALSHRPLKTDNVSTSGVFRTVEALRPLTLLVDEADSFLGDNEELRGILNSGFEQSGEVIRVVEVKDEWQPIRFATFCPVALAGIGKLPGTLEDRAVPIVLSRKAAAETVQKLRVPGARTALQILARKLARWAADRARHLPSDPQVPEAMGDREGDISVPLLAIADDAGGEWPRRARKALLEVFGVRAAAEGTAETGSLLLADIRLHFLGTSSLQMASQAICDHLATLDERPWPEWRHGKPMTPPQLARALAPFGIRPSGTIRVGHTTAKGYHKEAFEEAWTRYLPTENPVSAQMGGAEPSHRHNPGNSRASGQSATVTRTNGVTDRNALKAAENLACDGVTDRAPLYGPNGASHHRGAGGEGLTARGRA